MILTIDIGNSNICFAAHEKSPDPLFFERIHTGREKTVSSYIEDIRKIFKLHHLTKEDFEGAILSSVVAVLTDVLKEAVETVLERQILLVSSSLKLPYDIHAEDPSAIGADILCDITGALSIKKAPLMTFDLGTATVGTYIKVSENNRPCLEAIYILPGVRTSLSSLSMNTSSLPDIALDTPKSVIGKNTIESLQSGILYGTAGLVDGIVSQVEAAANTTCKVILTGGLSAFIAPCCTHEIIRDPALLMRGLYTLYELNQI